MVLLFCFFFFFFFFVCFCLFVVFFFVVVFCCCCLLLLLLLFFNLHDNLHPIFRERNNIILTFTENDAQYAATESYGKAAVSKLFLSPSEKGQLYKKRITPTGSKFFPNRVDPFSKGLVCWKANRKS